MVHNGCFTARCLIPVVVPYNSDSFLLDFLQNVNLFCVVWTIVLSIICKLACIRWCILRHVMYECLEVEVFCLQCPEGHKNWHQPQTLPFKNDSLFLVAEEWLSPALCKGRPLRTTAGRKYWQMLWRTFTRFFHNIVCCIYSWWWWPAVTHTLLPEPGLLVA